MSDGFGPFVVVAAAWLAIGFVLSIVMGRRGHNSFGWLVMGALLGPLGVLLAVDAQRHDERLKPVPLTGRVPATVGGGTVDVLVGYDGSPESAAAMDAVVELLGDRLRRLEGGHELIAVGTRGKGLAKAMLGSAASELARDSKVPVLLVGGR